MLKALQGKKDTLKISVGWQGNSSFQCTSPFYPAVILSVCCSKERQSLATGLGGGRFCPVLICLWENNNEPVLRWLEQIPVNATYFCSKKREGFMGKVMWVKGCLPGKRRWLAAPTHSMRTAYIREKASPLSPFHNMISKIKREDYHRLCFELSYERCHTVVIWRKCILSLFRKAFTGLMWNMRERCKPNNYV